MVELGEYVSSYLNTTRFHTTTGSDILVGVVICLIIVTTILGNALVILSVALFRSMRSRTNFMLVSLAVTDLLVGCIIMLVSLIYHTLRYWPFATIVCHFYTSLDVMLCTSSILHILTIAIDRYIAVMNPLRYSVIITDNRIKITLLLVWILSFAFAITPVLIYVNSVKDGDHRGPAVIFEIQCYYVSSKILALITSIVTFYIPLIIMSVLYGKVLIVARRQSKRVHPIETFGAEQGLSVIDGNSVPPDNVTMSTDQTQAPSARKRRKGDFKAARTLGLIMGCFGLCWMPFFIIHTVHPFIPTLITSPLIPKLVIWLGYCNSCMNPFLYAFNKDFRGAFKKIITCKYV